jgi:hypothetical protein
MHAVAMTAIRTRLDIAGALEPGTAAIAEGIFIGGDDIAARLGRCGGRLDHGGERRSRHRAKQNAFLKDHGRLLWPG